MLSVLLDKGRSGLTSDLERRTSMPGNRTGGLKTRDKNLAKDPDFYAKIGSIGGSKRFPKGFALMPHEKVVAASKKGGASSKPYSKNPKPLPEDNDARQEMIAKMIKSDKGIIGA